MCSIPMTNAAAIGQLNNFIAVCPEGIGNSWNVGSECCGKASEENVDDVQFAKDVQAWVKQRLLINDEFTFAAGYSNGGLLSYRLICQASEVFRGAGPAAGTYFGNQDGGYDCRPAVRLISASPEIRNIKQLSSLRFPVLSLRCTAPTMKWYHTLHR